MQRSLVGGPLLGSIPVVAAVDGDAFLDRTRTIAPVTVTVPSGNGVDVDVDSTGTTKPLRLLLLASQDKVTVLNAANGQRVGTLVVSNEEEMEEGIDASNQVRPHNTNRDAHDSEEQERDKLDSESRVKGDDDDEDNDDEDNDDDDDDHDRPLRHDGRSRLHQGRRFICSMAVASPSSEATVWVGCTDGTVHVFDLQTVNLARVHGEKPDGMARPSVTYRVAAITAHVTFLAVAPRSKNDAEHTLYALLTTPRHRSSSNSSSNIGSTVSLVRFSMPTTSSSSPREVLDSLPAEPLVVNDTTSRIIVDWQGNDTDDDHHQTKELDSFQCQTHRAKSNPHPFSMHVVTRLNDNVRVILLASATKLLFYCDTLKDAVASKPTRPWQKICMDSAVWMEPLTVCQMHGEDDLVCGHASGGMRVLHNLWPALARYIQSKGNNSKNNNSNKVVVAHNPPSLVRSILIRKVHWHAHALGCLAYDSASGQLFSGGDESVLVTWHLPHKRHSGGGGSGGTSDRPIHTLPRMAVGAIAHLLALPATPTRPETILVVCRDNSVQLVECQSKALVWKFQGLAVSTVANESNADDDVAETTNESISIRLLHNSDHVLALSGLPEAPGSIHWYDTNTLRVVSHWDIVPFNRVSHTERRESNQPSPPTMPTPKVTHVVFAARHTVAITVDIVPTENTSVGAVANVSSSNSSSNAPCGSVSSIRFWQVANTSSKSISAPAGLSVHYECVNAMSFPHGSRNRIAAVTLSADGTMAATVSNDESAIRLWYRRTVRSVTERSERDRRTDKEDNPPRDDAKQGDWTCRCKICIPSGYANFEATSLSFSPDASVLAVALGPFVTMWDLGSVALLTALRHDDDTSLVAMQFLPPSNRLSDGLMLLHSRTCVSLRSPYGNNGPNVGWNWKLPAEDIERNGGRISCVEFLASEEIVVIAQYDETTDSSQLVLIDAVLGLPFCNMRQSSSPVLGQVCGSVVALSTASHVLKRPGWFQDDESAVLTLYALTSKGELLRFSNKTRAKELETKPTDSVADRAVSALPQFGNESRLKRKLQVLEIGDLEQAPAGTLSLGQYGGGMPGNTGPIPSTELPLLRGAFVRAFIGRNLMRQDTAQ